PDSGVSKDASSTSPVEFRMTKPNSAGADGGPMQPQSTTGGPTASPELENLAALNPGLPVAPDDLEKLARWIPAKEMALLVEVCERAERDPDLARPALLLCSAYAERVAGVLDQHPCPTVTRRIAERPPQPRGKSGL